MPVAGSAIAQDVTFSKISHSYSRWLLLSGATDPPSAIAITTRRQRDSRGDKSGKFLKGISRDFVNMEDKIGTKLYNKVMNLHLKKADVQEEIEIFFNHCKENGYRPMLYYSGHGEIGTGDWCFYDGTLSIQEIDDMLPWDCYYPTIISDACYSGHWANYCLEENNKGFQCLSACPEFSSALDRPNEGGELTLFLTGKLSRPSKEPLYSGGNRMHYPFTYGPDKVSYTDFLRDHLKNTENILISQNICGQKFSGIFAPSKLHDPIPETAWVMKPSYDDLQDERCKANKNIYSLACDEVLGFGCYFMSGYGDSQSIVSCDNETITSKIMAKYNEGKKITSCTARGSTYYIVLTKNVVSYHGKHQIFLRRNHWSKIEDKIIHYWNNGYVITGICYNHGLGEYFVVMTESTATQNCEWFNDECDKFMWEFYEENDEERHPTIYFLDPNDDQLLVVCTSDKKRSEFFCKTWSRFSLCD